MCRVSVHIDGRCVMHVGCHVTPAMDRLVVCLRSLDAHVSATCQICLSRQLYLVIRTELDSWR